MINRLDQCDYFRWSNIKSQPIPITSCDDIGVVIPANWRHYLFYLQPYFSALGIVLFFNRSRELFCPWCSLSLSEIYNSVIDIFWYEVFIVGNTVKNWTILIFGRYLYKTRHFWNAIAHHCSFSLSKKHVTKIIKSRLLKKNWLFTHEANRCSYELV